MPGFRPGKVPANLIRKMHGPALMQDALNTAIQDGIQTLIASNKLRPAMQPSVSLENEYEDGKDAELKVELEILPDVPTPAIDAIKLERLTVPADDAAIQAQLQKFADQQKIVERHQGRLQGQARATSSRSISSARPPTASRSRAAPAPTWRSRSARAG